MLTVQVLVNGAFLTSRRVSYPFCSPLFPVKKYVQWVSGKKLHLGKLPNFLFVLPCLLCCYFGICVYGCCPFASARDAQDGGLRVPVMQHAQ